jgi:uridine monophosphate synthetase
LFDAGIVKFGSFTLKSGSVSPIYLDLRLLVSHPGLLRNVASLLAQKAGPLSFDRVAGIPYAALAIATAVSLQSGVPMVFCRKEAKDYGTKKMVEGDFSAGETVLVIDDLITTGGSKLEAVKPLQDAGLKVSDFMVVIDRQQGGRQELEAKGYRLHALLTVRDLFSDLAAARRISPEEFAQFESFMQNPSDWKPPGGMR